LNALANVLFTVVHGDDDRNQWEVVLHPVIPSGTMRNDSR
jgi:hypothetical protein